MGYFTNKLPFILSAVMALFTGVLGFLANKSYNFIYASMLISILIFGLLGFIARDFIAKIINEIKRKEEESNSANQKEKETKGSIIDLKADDSNYVGEINLNTDVSTNPEVNDFYTDGFSPLEVSKVIRTNVDNDE